MGGCAKVCLVTTVIHYFLILVDTIVSVVIPVIHNFIILMDIEVSLEIIMSYNFIFLFDILVSLVNNRCKYFFYMVRAGVELLYEIIC